MRNLLKNYLESSSIHGLSYLVQRYHIAERIFWTLALLASLFLTCLMTFQLMTKIQNCPIVMHISDQQMSVNEVEKFRKIKNCDEGRPA
jgi:hypothetical protein